MIIVMHGERISPRRRCREPNPDSHDDDCCCVKNKGNEREHTELPQSIPLPLLTKRSGSGRLQKFHVFVNIINRLDPQVRNEIHRLEIHLNDEYYYRSIHEKKY